MKSVEHYLEKWMNKKLTEKDIYKYAKNHFSNKIKRLNLTEDDLKHVARITHLLYRNYHGKRKRLGDFTKPVVMNDLSRACGIADQTNQKAICLYTDMLYNIAPSDWRSKIKEKVVGPRAMIRKLKRKTSYWEKKLEEV